MCDPVLKFYAWDMALGLRRGFLFLLVSLFCSGCGQTVSLVGVHLNGTLDSSLRFYHAYGDSITYGYTLADPSTQAYPALLARSTGLPLENYAIGGDQACDVPTRQIFPHVDNPSIAAKGLYSILISTNDIQVKGAGDYETVFKLCLDASIAWLALPTESNGAGFRRQCRRWRSGFSGYFEQLECAGDECTGGDGDIGRCTSPPLLRSISGTGWPTATPESSPMRWMAS